MLLVFTSGSILAVAALAGVRGAGADSFATDLSVARLRSLAEAYLASPPEDWDGVAEFHVK